MHVITSGPVRRLGSALSRLAALAPAPALLAAFAPSARAAEAAGGEANLVIPDLSPRTSTASTATRC